MKQNVNQKNLQQILKKSDSYENKLGLEQVVICISKSINHFFGVLYSTTFSLLFLDCNDPSKQFFGALVLFAL